jgi:hypothetical protein
MKTHVLRGSKQEIEGLARISGEVREAIVFEEEPASAPVPATGGADLFAEMRPFMVDVPDVVDSRDAIYTRAEGE